MPSAILSKFFESSSVPYEQVRQHYDNFKANSLYYNDTERHSDNVN